ncbi:MAG: hypothetical protein D6683_07095 [Actinomyces sp.]|nr:MAG: hypothetical protein D6683_07095 [Actinomyces sp.]
MASLLVATALLVAAPGPLAGAGAPTSGDTAASEEVDAATVAADGTLLVEELDAAGWGDTWRDATALTPQALGVRIDPDPETGRLGATLVALARQRIATTTSRQTTVADLDATEAALVRARITVDERTRDRDAAAADLAADRDRLSSVAIALYQGGQARDDDLLAVDADRVLGADRHLAITATTLEEMQRRVTAAEETLARTSDELAAAVATRDTLADTVARLRVELHILDAHLDELDRRSAGLITELAPRWILAPVHGAAPLTPRALDAYVRAELVHTVFEPGCRLSWATLAAVAGVESAHGTHGGAHLLVDGRTDRPIVGLRLDGIAVDGAGETVAAIADTDGGRIDGDPVHDRAIGPFQFVPQTWQSWARDGDKDGRLDPHDIDDAAMTAAAYLCSYGRLSRWETWNAAVFGYNHSNAYVASVKAGLDRLNRLRIGTAPDDYPTPPRRPAGPYVAPPPEPGAPPVGPDAAPGDPTG